MSFYDEVQEAAAYCRALIKEEPRIGIILGSGLGALAEEMEETAAVPYAEIPHFPVSTVAGHAGRLLFGRFRGRRVVMMEGRPHYYEGHPMKRLGLPMYLMKFLGVKTLVITNACGAINRDFSPGTLMILEDFINFVSVNPLTGENDERLGPRFPDMSEPYSFRLIERAERIADELGIGYAKGIYAGFWGPYFETRSEIRALGILGADAVGMSTVPETIAANHAGLECFAVGCITNMATGIRKEKHSHQEVLEIADRASAELRRWICEFVARTDD